VTGVAMKVYCDVTGTDLILDISDCFVSVRGYTEGKVIRGAK